MSENRIKQHKFAGKKEIIRETRRNVNVQLRKNAREDQMSKRRNMDGDLNKSPLKEKSPLREMHSGRSLRENLTIDEAFQDICSPDPTSELSAVRSVRKLLSQDKRPPIDAVISKGFIPALIEKLKDFTKDDVQLEAAWALTNIASGAAYQTAAVVSAGAIPHLINLFDSRNPSIVEQAIWALGNIAGDGAEMRDKVLAINVVPKLMPHIRSDAGKEFLRNLTWMMSNLCRNDPTPPIELIKDLLAPYLALLCWEDSQVQADAAWGISYVTNGSEDHVTAVCAEQNGAMVDQLMKLLSERNKSTTVPSLRALGNIVTGTDEQTQFALDRGFLKIVPDLLESHYGNIVKEVCWAVSNICAGTKAQVQAVQDIGVIPTILRILKEGDFKQQKEAAYVIANIASTGTKKNIEYLIDHDALTAMMSVLDCADSTLVACVINFYSDILKQGERMNKLEEFSTLIEENGALDKIENLQNHENSDVYEAALKIIEQYFGEFEETVGQGQDGLYEFRQPLAENQNFQF